MCLVTGNGGTIFSWCKKSDLSIFYNRNQRPVKIHKVTLDWPGLRISVEALEYRHLISIVGDLIDNMSFPSLDIDILVAYKFFFTGKKCEVTGQCTFRNLFSSHPDVALVAACCWTPKMWG